MKSNARNSINEDGHTQSHDVSIIEDDLSDLDSEINNVEVDEDNRLNADEKLDKIDRFCRRYWKLLKADGIFIEAQESAQNDICRYQALESMDDKDFPDEELRSANPTAGA
ncbi:GH22449 [Drosophila grimshawi]|uniref:GH22449 n=1 Tax=Drosophila grimshawi TaxID=7222 RepID=B4K104_DROGR|nr:GH22449 [Drosophila grimshawi]